MTPQDTARAIVEKIAGDIRAWCDDSGDALSRVEEWVALVVPEVENLHAEAIRRAEAAEKRAEELQSEKDSLTAAYCVTVDAREAAEKERDEFKSALVAEVERGQRLLQTEERLAQRVLDLEAKGTALLPFLPVLNDAPQYRHSVHAQAVAAFRALLSPPPAPQPEEPEDLWFHRCHNCKTEYVGPEHGPRRCTTCGASTWVTSRQCQGCLDRGWVHTADQKCLLPQATASAAPSAPAPPTKTEEPT